MKSSFLKKAVPHLIAIGIFLVIAIIYCSPALQGKVVNQHDVVGWKGMAQQSFEYKEKYGHFPLWSNSMFSGMPAYTFAMEQKYPVSVGYVYSILTLGLPAPISFFFAACLYFYFLCQVLRIRPWISVMAAIAFAYSTYDPIIIAVGHNTKMLALTVAPAVVASFLLLLQKKYWWGMGLLAIFAGYQIGTQHLQIVYYTLITLGFISICYLIYSWKNSEIKHAFISFGLALFAGLIAFFSNAVSMLPLQEYAKETMRGGRSELTDTTGNKTKGGLNKDYAFMWSYGIGETATLLVPAAYGGSSGPQELGENSKLIETLTTSQLPQEFVNYFYPYFSAYWGDQPNTSGPVYLGAVICFLFIFALFYLKSWHKWWLVSISLLGIVMAWGSHFSSVNYFLFDYLPFYNKFRAPTMSLVLPQFAFPILAGLGVEQLLNDTSPREAIWKKFRMSIFVAAGLLAVLILFYVNGDFKGKNDTQIRDGISMQLSQGNSNPQMQQQAQTLSQSFIRAVQEDRKSLFGSDLLRSFVFIALTVILVGAYIKNKVKSVVVVIGLVLLSSSDLLPIGKRYLNDEKYVEKDEFENSIQATAADRQIMADPAKPFRVFDQTEEWHQSSRASYFHNSIGGYHPAKLALYNDLIEHQIGKGNMEVLNMLNTKYFIMQDPSSRQVVARVNTGAYGPAWMVKAIKYVSNADMEMKALDSTNLRDTAIVQEKYKAAIKLPPQYDSTASIKVTDYLNDIVRYDFNSPSNQFVVFSEIYYPHGWDAYIDGQKTEFVKTNYALRGLSVPAGKHKIEFRFEPNSYNLGNTIGLIASLIAYILLGLAIFFEVRKRPSASLGTRISTN